MRGDFIRKSSLMVRVKIVPNVAKIRGDNVRGNSLIKFASFIGFLNMDIDRPPIKGSTSHPGFNVGQISVKIPQFLGLGGRPVCNILVATQPLVSVWELLMGVGKMGKLPILLPLQPSRSVSEPVKRRILVKRSLLRRKSVTCILRARPPPGVSARCEKGWRVTKEQLLSDC